MRVGGEKVDPVAIEQFIGKGFGHPAEAPVEGGGGDLDEASRAHPVGEQIGALVERLVALRMGDDEGVAGVLQPAHGLGELGRDHHVGELDEQVTFSVDRITERVLNGVEDVGSVQVEVAPEAQLELTLEQFAQLGQALLVHRGLIGMRVAGVGGADDVGDALGGSFVGHGQGGFQIGRSVVDAVDQMVVNVDHFDPFSVR